MAKSDTWGQLCKVEREDIIVVLTGTNWTFVNGGTALACAGANGAALAEVAAGTKIRLSTHAAEYATVVASITNNDLIVLVLGGYLGANGVGSAILGGYVDLGTHNVFDLPDFFDTEDVMPDSEGGEVSAILLKRVPVEIPITFIENTNNVLRAALGPFFDPSTEIFELKDDVQKSGANISANSDWTGELLITPQDTTTTPIGKIQQLSAARNIVYTINFKCTLQESDYVIKVWRQ